MGRASRAMRHTLALALGLATVVATPLSPFSPVREAAAATSTPVYLGANWSPATSIDCGPGQTVLKFTGGATYNLGTKTDTSSGDPNYSATWTVTADSVSLSSVTFNGTPISVSQVVISNNGNGEAYSYEYSPDLTPTVADPLIENASLGATPQISPMTGNQYLFICATDPTTSTRLRLVKQVLDGATPASAWTLSATGTNATLSGTTGVVSYVTPGTYTLTESNDPQYRLANLSCATAIGTSVPVTNGQVTTGAGDLTCTFVNRVRRITLDMQKYVNGADADTAAASITVSTGAPLTWTYVITNTGTETLTNVTVTDDRITDDATDIDCPAGTNDNVIPSLLPAASVICVATGVAAVTPYVNVGTVTGTDGVSVATASDPAHHTVVAPSVRLIKRANGQDVNAEPGVFLPVGSAVTWTYEVTNTGAIALGTVVVADDQIVDDAADIDCPDGTNSNVITVLVPGATVTCTARGTVTSGQYTNVGSANGTPIDGGTEAGGQDPASYFGAAPAISLVKRIGTADANDGSSFPVFAPGDPVSFSFVVTNIGNVPLADVAVTDSITAGGDAALFINCDGDNVIGFLAVDATVTCTATGTAGSVRHRDLSTVTGNPVTFLGADIPTFAHATDSDEANYDVVSIAIEKLVNTIDADTAGSGPVLSSGAPITWSYVVTNTGSIGLTGITVTDDKLAASSIDCGGGTNAIATLAVGASVTCSATGSASLLDTPHVNRGTVVATGSGIAVSAFDDAHHTVGSPLLQVVKTVNGNDANVAPGPYLPVGSPLTWSYVVTNTGSFALTNVIVTDDKVASADIECPLGATNIIASLAAGATVTCTATGVVVAGGYVNTGSVTGTPTDGGTSVSDTDEAHHVGASPAMTVKKFVVDAAATRFDGEDAAADTWPSFEPSDNVVFEVVVTNTGNVPLANVVVIDTVATPVGAAALTFDCDNGADVDGDNVIDGLLATGAAVTCTATAIAGSAHHRNLATASGNPVTPAGVDIAGLENTVVSDEANYDVADVTVQKFVAVNGGTPIDADTSVAGPIVSDGAPLTWTYVVTNTGSTALSDVTVTDDRVAASTIDCGTGSNVIATLAAGERVTCTASGRADITTPDYVNVGSVTGASAGGADVTASDPAHHAVKLPTVQIVKTVNGVDANATPGPIVLAGETVTWTYTVTNTGPLPLIDITVTDDKIAAADIDCADTTSNVIASLAVNATAQCTATGPASAGQYTNTGTASGIPTDGGNPAVDTDLANSFGATPGVTIVKRANGVDANDDGGWPSYTAGETIVYTFEVTNSGNVSLMNVTVTDTVTAPLPAADVAVNCNAGTDVDNDNVIDGRLEAGSTVTCRATGTASILGGRDIARATGTPVTPAGTALVGAVAPVDTDEANYHSAAVTVQKLVNSVDADTVATALAVTPGAPLTWSYVVTNTGTAPLATITVTDDKLADDSAAIDCGNATNVITNLAPNTATTCVAKGVASALEPAYVNVGTATATTAGGTAVTSSDAAHHHVVAPSLSVIKRVNGSDADAAPGLYLLTGDPITWEYVITNDGPIDLFDVLVTDDKITDDATAIDCTAGAGSTNVIASLPAGESVSCVATGVVVAGQYTNVATVTGTPGDGGDTVSVTNAANSYGVSPSINIVKSVNGVDANDDQPESWPTYGVGVALSWNFTITNTGDTALAAVTVGDPSVGTITCSTVGADTNGDRIIDLLPVGDSVDCTASGTTSGAGFRNVASVSGQAVDATGTQLPGIESVTSTDEAQYLGASPSLLIVKSVNGADANDLQIPHPTANVGTTLQWVFLVTNNGGTNLADVTLTDARVSGISCAAHRGDTDANAVIALMLPLDSVRCTATSLATAGPMRNVASVTGTPMTPDGQVIAGPVADDGDEANVIGQTPVVNVEKFVNGTDADAAPGVDLNVGTSAVWTYSVTSGAVALENVAITDDRVMSSAISCPIVGTDTDRDNVIALLPANSTVTCSATGTVTAGAYVNRGSVTATPVGGGAAVSDTDDAHHRGLTSSLTVIKKVNGTLAGPGAVVPHYVVGSTVTWTYTVTNTGQTIVQNVTVTDDRVAASSIDCGNGSNVIPQLLVGAAPVTCTARGVVTPGAYRNIATVAGEPVGGGTEPDDTDEANHVGDPVAVYDLALIKTLPATAKALLFGTLTYTVTVANQGNVASGAFTVVDVLPAGTAFVSANNGGMFSAGKVTWNVPAPGILAGARKAFTVTVKVTAQQPLYRNWAEIARDSGPDEDSTPDAVIGRDATAPNDRVIDHDDLTKDTVVGDEDDHDVEAIKDSTRYDLALVKTVAAGQATAVGSVVTYVITVRNQGNVASSAFTVTDRLPSGMAYVSSSPAGVLTQRTVNWKIANLAAGATMKFTVKLRITDPALRYRNWAEITADSGNDKDSLSDGDVGDNGTPANDPTVDHNDIAKDTVAGDEDDNDFADLTPALNTPQTA